MTHLRIIKEEAVNHTEFKHLVSAQPDCPQQALVSLCQCY